MIHYKNKRNFSELFCFLGPWCGNFAQRSQRSQLFKRFKPTTSISDILCYYNSCAQKSTLRLDMNNTNITSMPIEKIPQILGAILLSISESLFDDIKYPSSDNLSSSVTILQKLISCYAELKPLANNITSNSVSQETICRIQSQLNLL